LIEFDFSLLRDKTSLNARNLNRPASGIGVI